ncbi:NUDIX domain-containing protein [Thalassotalea euphylliae]|uniref:NUDIX hydrolase n=1 Tax=Thalassotalea euphylliae TaxID=1655234 RepID=UPI00363481BD
MKTIDKLAWLYIKNNKLLCARSKNKSLFYIPGGKRDPGENDEQALIREIDEEISVALIPETITYADTFLAPADGKDDGTKVKMTCYFAEYTGNASPAAEIEEITYLGYTQRHETSIASVKVFDWLYQQGLINE